MSTPPSPAISAIKPAARVRDLALRGASLREVQAPGLRAEAVDFRGADLAGARLNGARLIDCELQDASLEGADLTGATIRTCRLGGVRAAGAVMVRARLEDSAAQGADFTRVNLTAARLTETSFARAVLRGAVLGEASGEGADFRGADFAGACLSAARLIDADFRGADLTGASLAHGCFKGADFRGAILDAVDWGGAELAGALFDIGAEPTEFEKPSPANEAPETAAEPLVAWTERLLKRTVSALPPEPAGHRSARSPAELQQLIDGLRRTLAARGVKSNDLLSSFQQVLDTLQTAPDSEPPEVWKPALAPVLARLREANREPDVKEVFKLLLEGLSHAPRPKDSAVKEPDVGGESASGGAPGDTAPKR